MEHQHRYPSKSMPNSACLGVLTELVFAGHVGDLEDIERDSVNAGLAEGVEPGDVRALVVDPLEHRGQLRVVVVLELHILDGQGRLSSSA